MRKETKIIVQKNIDYKCAIMEELKDKHVHQARIADLYACAISLKSNETFRVVNLAIINRWSQSGLVRVKTMAWKLLEDPDIFWYKQ